jgi:oligopeptide transport system substrate-binding protein
MQSPSRRATLGYLSAFGLLPAVGAVGACGGAGGSGNVLRVAMGGGPDSLDPLRAEFAAAALLFRNYMKPVVGYGPNGTAVPAVAASWEGSNGYKTWTFKIAPGLKWSDETPINAASVADTIKKSAFQRPAYPDASEYFSIKGYQEVAVAAVVTDAAIAAIGVATPDDSTVVIELVAPDADFPARLQEFYPVPLHVVAQDPEKWTDPEKIVVSGPFKPVERTPTRLVLEKNPLGGWSEGMVDRILIEAVDDAGTRIRMFSGGNVDLAQDPPLSRAAELKEEFGERFSNTKAPRWIYMSMNTKREQLQDVDVRRALAMSINRDFIANEVMKGAVEPAGRFMRGEAQPKFDPEAAKAILESKGYNAANPLKIELLHTKDERERAAIQMQSDWKAIGVDCTLFGAEASAIVGRLNAFDFDAAIVRLDKGLKSDPLDLMASYGTGGTAYSHQWSDAGFDAALNAVRAEADPARRKALTEAAEKFLLDAAPVTGIWFFPSSWLMGERVTGGIEGIAPIIWPSLRLKAG